MYYQGLHAKALLLALDGDCGWNYSETRRHIQMFRFLKRVLKINPSRFTRNVFKIDYRNFNNNWCYEIKQLFAKAGKIELYNNQSLCDIHDM